MKRYRKNIRTIVEKTDTGYSAFADKFNVFTTGKNLSELLHNMVEAMNLYFEDKYVVSAKNIDLQFDLKLFFQYYRVLNSRFLADRIGMHKTLLSQYVNGKKIPSKKQSERIMEGIHEIGKELSDVNLV